MRLLNHRTAGQSLTLIALILPVLVGLLFTCVEVSTRYQQLAQIQDALQQSSRSAVQTFAYSAFAQGTERGRETHDLTVTGCTNPPKNSAQSIACQVFLTNLSNVDGLKETPTQTAARVTWTILPDGGTCSYPNGKGSISFARPAVCATLRPQMLGLLGWGVWSPQIDAGDTLDRINN
jgi:hypothetical protein